MKSLKFSSFILCCLCCSFVYAGGTTYKGVTIDRYYEDNKVIVVWNENAYPVQIKMQYKIGNRDTEWIDYSRDLIEIPANKKQLFPVGYKIYGLNLIYVDILQPSVGEKILEAGAAFFSGVEAERQKKANGQ